MERRFHIDQLKIQTRPPDIFQCYHPVVNTDVENIESDNESQELASMNTVTNSAPVNHYATAIPRLPNRHH